MDFRRINIFGGPGCGKSTVAANVFSRMKSDGHNIELVDEYVKSWAYEKREINKFDQAYLFTRQLRKEYLVLKNSSGMIITDSPLHLSICYAKRCGFARWDCLQSIANDFEDEYPSINVILDRVGCEYKQEGRYEDYNQAIEVDATISNYIYNCGIEWCMMRFNDHDGIYQWIKSTVSK